MTDIGLGRRTERLAGWALVTTATGTMAVIGMEIAAGAIMTTIGTATGIAITAIATVTVTGADAKNAY